MNFPYVNLFLKRFRSDKTKKLYFKRLNELRDYLSDKKTLNEIKTIDMTRFFMEVVEPKKMTEKTKKKYVSLYNNYFNFLIKHEAMGKNPVDTDQTFSNHLDQQTLTRRLKPSLTKEDITKIISHAKLVNYSMYIYLCILCQTGGRDGEIRSIRLENINLHERVILSGIEEGAAKEGLCMYFIQTKFVPILENYINSLRMTYNNPTYLFPSNSSTGFITGRSTGGNLKKYSEILNINDKTNPHSFRHYLNNQRLRLGCNDSVMALLLNQSPKGTNAQYYLRLLEDIKTKREFYDNFTPIFEF